MSTHKWTKRVKLCVIAGDKKTNDLMQSMDMTDGGHKLFATVETFDITLSNVVTRKYVIDQALKAAKQTRQPVAAIFFLDSKEGHWVDNKIHTVSNGNKWFVLREFIKAQWNANKVKDK